MTRTSNSVPRDSRPRVSASSGLKKRRPRWKRARPAPGEVPKHRPGEENEEDDDLAAWASLGGAPRWRDSNSDWDDDGDLADLAGDEPPVGALDMTRTDHSDLYAFDEPPEVAEEPP